MEGTSWVDTLRITLEIKGKNRMPFCIWLCTPSHPCVCEGPFGVPPSVDPGLKGWEIALVCFLSAFPFSKNSWRWLGENPVIKKWPSFHTRLKKNKAAERAFPATAWPVDKLNWLGLSPVHWLLLLIKELLIGTVIERWLVWATVPPNVITTSTFSCF